VIAVPGDSAQEICDELVANGIRAIWNFAPVHLQVPSDVLVHNENLAVSLSALQVQMKKRSTTTNTQMNHAKGE
jgi:redox-sensing transcriptional repressor